MQTYKLSSPSIPLAKVASTLILAFTVLAVPVKAETMLGGSWSGGGRVIFQGGNTERARCRAHFVRQSSKRYFMSGVCATQSARVSQTATIVQTTNNKYYGRFHNEEFNVTGTLRISIRGGRMTATLKGKAGSAVLSLRRR